MRTRTMVALLICLGGCGRAVEPEPEPENVDVATVRTLLLAWHGKDLPDANVLARHPGAAAALHELAWKDERMIVRRRAATALGELAPGDPVAERWLVEILEAPEVTADLRAAALRGMGRCDLDGRADLRAAVEAHAFAPEVQVAYAAVAALRGRPAARATLERVVADGMVDERVRSFAAQGFSQPDRFR